MKKLCLKFVTLSIMIGTLVTIVAQPLPHKTTSSYQNCGLEGYHCVGSGRGTCCPGLICYTNICGV